MTLASAGLSGAGVVLSCFGFGVVDVSDRARKGSSSFTFEVDSTGRRLDPVGGRRAKEGSRLAFAPKGLNGLEGL
jgi:hypothetical protein